MSANDGVNDMMEDYGFGKNYFRHKPHLKKITYYPRMIQRWNMFSPSVLASDKVLVVEATSSTGEIINPYTGKAPILNSLDYKDLWHDDNQLWRKFFSRVTKNNKKKELERYESWLRKYTNNYFSDNMNGHSIRTVKIWSLSQRNPSMNSKVVNKVTKRLMNPKTANTRSKGPLKTKPKSINSQQEK